MAKTKVESFEFADQSVRAGTRVRFNIPCAELPLGNPVQVPVIILHGKYPGPTIWLNAALHGDELNGIEILRQVLEVVKARLMHGTIIAVPIVNVYGFINESRYLPDRRDLNRSFPGNISGSLASRLARWFMHDIVARCELGVDLHTGSDHRNNFPQVRGDLSEDRVRELAKAFAAPVTLHAKKRSGSLRAAAGRQGKPVLVYEGGECLKFNQNVIEFGVDGILRLLAHLGIYTSQIPFKQRTSMLSQNSKWVRAKRSGILRLEQNLGDFVHKGDKLGVIEDILSGRYRTVKSTQDGLIIGAAANPLVYQGDAIIHIAQLEETPSKASLT